MIEEFGILGVLWFLALSAFGIAVGIKLGGQNKHDDPVLGMEDGTAQIVAHGSMVMALALSAPALEAYLNVLVTSLPQSGSEINKITALTIVGASAFLWVVLPALIAMARCDRRDTTEKG